ncbi:MAG TPA: AtzE family amidohydrolase [Burkholderiaceae bacterium]|jgi:amidase/aspartyl-tRNA(Asn)/glutamyl-tRNA(Gln) amidotransferase subunit A
MNIHQMSAAQLAHAVRERTLTAKEIVTATLERIEAVDGSINAFTCVTSERAITEANAIDRLRDQDASLPPLAGVPFAVKNLFDLEGVVTLAGSKVLQNNPAASSDAVLVARLKQAGGICVGALNMDEFAYGFTTENSHAGPSRNPHDTTRIAGGSSGGCGAAIAAGMVPISLGSDTNGSIRVPSSLCGVLGLKPTYGRLSRNGSFPFVTSLDHLGPFSRSVEDLALAYDACQGPDPHDPACAQKAIEPTRPTLAKGIDGLRIARLTGYFDAHATPIAQQASRLAAQAFGTAAEIELPGVALARAAAFTITSSEGGALHLSTIRDQYEDYEPLSRDRFVAGALTPAAWYLKAQRFRSLFQQNVRNLFKQYDILIAPATPCPAWPIGTEWVDINGTRFPARASMGLLTQPISFIGLPVVAVPIHQAGELPVGVQLIAAPWREDLALRAAAYLETKAVAQAPVATL